MERKGSATSDLAFILYVMPFILAAAYGLTLWIPRGLSFSIPQDVYLIVTKDPLLFIAGLACVCAGFILDSRSGGPEGVLESVRKSASTFDRLAISALILSAITAWSGTGWTSSFSQWLGLFLTGRYSVIFPLALILIAYPSSHRLNVRSDLTLPIGVIGIALALASPLTFSLAMRIGIDWASSASLAVLLFVVGGSMTGLALVRSRKDREQPKTQPSG